MGSCSSIASASITLNAQPQTPGQPTLGSAVQPTCASATGSFAITNYNAAYTYSVTPSAGVTISGNTVTAPAGTYTVKATLGSCSSIASASRTINTKPTSCTGIFYTTLTCSAFSSDPTSQLVRQLCYTTQSSKVANVTPGQFFYSTNLTAPSASFCIEITETKNSSSLALFSVNQNNQITLYNANCGNVASGVQISLGLGRVCITNAVPGAKYILFVKYDAKSIVNAAFTGTAPTVQYNFVSKINGVAIPGSAASINLVPNCPSPARTTAEVTAKTTAEATDSILAKVYPNPSNDSFNLQINSSSEDNVMIRIIDTNGRIIKEFISNPKEIIRFGSELTSGLYFVEITQGMERKVVKAQKL